MEGILKSTVIQFIYREAQQSGKPVFCIVDDTISSKTVLIMSQNHTPEFKKKIVHFHEEEGQTHKSIVAEYGAFKVGISRWCSAFSKECQVKAQARPDAPNEMELMKENLRLRREK